MDNIKGTVYREVFKDAYKLFNDGLPVDHTFEYWQRMNALAAGLDNKYKRTEAAGFARKQILSVMDALENIGKNAN